MNSSSGKYNTDNGELLGAEALIRRYRPDTGQVIMPGKFIPMAGHLGLRVVSEGVETLAQHEFLREAGCDEVQGFYFARPMPADTFERHLKRADQ